MSERENILRIKAEFTGRGLKWIAIITMFIDHFAASILYHRILLNGYNEYINVYLLLRDIGRIAFPIFCFLLTEGVIHTHSKTKYLCEMALFAIISEIPFDLALHFPMTGKVFDLSRQNVFFTLLLGMTAILIIQKIDEKFSSKWYFKEIGIVITVIIFYFISYFMHTDYAGYGVLAILAIYLFRNNRFLAIMTACIVLTGFNERELPCFFATIPVLMYNGTSGNKKHKMFFYWFYPVHLLLFGLIRIFYLK